MGEPARGALTVVRGSFEGMEYALDKPETLIGRSPTTDITLLDEGISREHALLVYDGERDAFLLEDLQSTNGTRVNGVPARSQELAAGDEIRIGHTILRFAREA